ncbi:zinc finger MYM-type protein 1 [Chelonia mydas]|uniref:zinc finger MYM-type protein 1 n=1 Tax=Chelonia mydas TaxID=8469 RepID=UPI0018A1EB3B|nr:zinc finger MYM-type protein 1 [Chelonia mydas]XP_027675563.2 zinc finger MYM-type protein 1 [Chelonia mydas]XP_037768491.1 zinc finger MYM-type protein 1 [Chelonia mydas]XP_043381040.1 zinc finger MYM-type protein 1 [Chelonia mydas]XP_043381041.1 zinc finger MYM-type protein 1 [Chelonia mydas]
MCLSKTRALDKHTADGNIKERNYWTEVLKRVIATIKFLAIRGLALSGTNETFGSLNNGNFLGCLELIAEYDPFLACHINNYGNTGHGTTSHLSSTICEEFIKLMADKLKQVIVDELKLAKYFFFSTDSTLDTSHTDQLTLTVRYVLNNCTPVERFLNFVPVTSHTGLHLFNVINGTLNDKLNINLKDCRGQTYDRASNLPDTYSGVQARVIAGNEKAVYIPCMTHSLNLRSVAAAESCTDAITFFRFIQNLYVFFSGSTYCWGGASCEILCTRRHVRPVRENFSRSASVTQGGQFKRVHFAVYRATTNLLQALGADTLQNGYTRAEANSLQLEPWLGWRLHL